MRTTLRRRLAATLTAVAVVSVLTACSTTAGSAPAPEATSGWDGTQVTDHTLTIAFATGWTSLDPVNNNAGIRDLSVIRSLYSALTLTDEKGDVQPDIATEWERSADNAWTFTLRDDVVFPDGEKLDAANVVFNIERTLHEAENPSNWITASIANITSVVADSDYQVTITTQEPDLQLPRRLSGVYFVSSTFAASHDLKTEASGTGPYQLVSFNPDSEVDLVASEKYHGGVVPYKNVRLVLAADSAAKVNGLKTGEIDAANIIDPTDFSQLNDAGVETGAVPSARVMLLQVNASVEPLQDVKVRQAISLGIDRKAITDSIFQGLVEPAHDQNISDVYDAWNEELGFSEYDPKKAKKLLAEAGYPDGFTVEYLTTQNSTIANEQIAQIISSQLAEIGITLQLSVVPRAVGAERGASAETAAGLTYGGFIDTAVVAAETLRYIGSTHNQAFSDVAVGYDEAVAAARAANSDKEKQAAIDKATELALANQQTIYLWPLAQTFAHSADVVWPIRADDYLLPFTITPAE